MNEETIARLVHRIRGMFPMAGVPKDTIIETWSADRRLREIELDNQQKEHLLGEIEKLGTWPTLPQLRAFIMAVTLQLQNGAPERCEWCDDTGWDNGLRLSGTMQNPVVESPALETTFGGYTYTQVIPCRCSRGCVNAGRLRTLQRQ